MSGAFIVYTRSTTQRRYVIEADTHDDAFDIAENLIAQGEVPGEMTDISEQGEEVIR